MKTWWNSYRGVFVKWTLYFRREICKSSHLYGRDDWWTPIFILNFQRGSDEDSLCKVSWNSYCVVYFKWIQWILNTSIRPLVALSVFPDLVFHCGFTKLELWSSTLFLPYLSLIVISQLYKVEETGMPGENYRLAPSHWQHTHMLRLGRKLRKWWETASTQWQGLRPHGHQGRHHCNLSYHI